MGKEGHCVASPLGMSAFSVTAERGPATVVLSVTPALTHLRDKQGRNNMQRDSAGKARCRSNPTPAMRKPCPWALPELPAGPEEHSLPGEPTFSQRKAQGRPTLQKCPSCCKHRQRKIKGTENKAAHQTKKGQQL